MYDKISLDRVYGFLILGNYKGLHNIVFKFFTQDLGQTQLDYSFGFCRRFGTKTRKSYYVCKRVDYHNAAALPCIPAIITFERLVYLFTKQTE